MFLSLYPGIIQGLSCGKDFPENAISSLSTIYPCNKSASRGELPICTRYVADKYRIHGYMDTWITWISWDNMDNMDTWM